VPTVGLTNKKVWAPGRVDHVHFQMRCVTCKTSLKHCGCASQPARVKFHNCPYCSAGGDNDRASQDTNR
jgi:hypothetical protein